jgi:4-diphosphocytidyl-2-C-methyl-D-erythritol kinase
LAERRPISEPAPAKLNLFLRVLGKRSDGYHEIETLLQPLTLADGVRAEPLEEGLELIVAGEHASGVPRGEENLVLRAARGVAAACERARGARLLLVKKIPVAAGLGGGSADAAATLRALNDLWTCGLDLGDLWELAAALGSDVPGLLPGGPVLAKGRGERVEPVELPRTWWVLLSPTVQVRAEEAYHWWDEDGEPSGGDPKLLLRALSAGDITRAGPLLFNDLEGPVASRNAEVNEAKERLLAAGALGALMCGSGPTVAGLARGGRHADEIAQAVGGIACGSITRSTESGGA